MIASDLKGLEKIIIYFETKYMNSERDKRSKINLRSVIRILVIGKRNASNAERKSIFIRSV